MNNDYYHLSDAVKADINIKLAAAEKGCNARTFGELDAVVGAFSDAAVTSTLDKIPKKYLHGRTLTLYSAIAERTASWGAPDVTCVCLTYDQRKGWGSVEAFRRGGTGVRHQMDICSIGWSYIVSDLLKKRGLKVENPTFADTVEVEKITEVLECSMERLLAYIGDNSPLRVSDLAEYRLNKPQ